MKIELPLLPGINGSLGNCAVCDGQFVLEVLTGGSCTVVKVLGGHEVAVHDACVPDLLAARTGDLIDPTKLPAGWLRRTVEAMLEEASRQSN